MADDYGVAIVPQETGGHVICIATTNSEQTDMIAQALEVGSEGVIWEDKGFDHFAFLRDVMARIYRQLGKEG